MMARTVLKNYYVTKEEYEELMKCTEDCYEDSRKEVPNVRKAKVDGRVAEDTKPCESSIPVEKAKHLTWEELSSQTDLSSALGSENK